jgi:DNA-binding CsgD family transcriptional regulator/tetratricopeptide (TPR) repeat protein
VSLLGRDPELRVLAQACERVRDGDRRTLALVGEAGIGKTALLDAAAAQARTAGFLVLAGCAAEHQRHVPFGLVVDALDRHVATLTPARVAAAGPELGAVLPAAHGSHPPPDIAGPAERFRYHRALRSLLELLGRERPVALLLDDVHWADSASLELTEHLIRKPPQIPLLLAIAFRGSGAPARLVDAIGRLGAAAMLIDLPPLESADLEMLLTGVPRRRRELILRASLGNPLYITALSRLRDRTLDELSTLARQHSPVDADWLAGSQRYILAGLAAEITAQEQPVQRVAHVAAVVGDHTTIDLIGYVAGLPMDAVAHAVDQLGRMGLIEADGARLAYRHPLMRAAAYALTGPAWRFEAHTRTAEYLRGQQASRQVVAYHTEQSARYGDERAAATLVEAGIAFAHEAPAQAARWLGTALRIMPDTGPPDDRRCAVAMWYARALGRSGQLERSREVLAQLRGAAGPVRAQAEAFSVAVARQLGDFAEAAATLGAQLARGGLDPLGEAKLRVELSAVDAFREDPTAAVHHAQRALELLGQQRSVPVATAQTLRALGTLYAGDAVLARRYLAEAVRTVDGTSDADLRPYVEIISPLALTEIQLGHLADAARHLARARRILDALGPNSASPYLLVMEAALHTRTGQLPRAVEVAEEAIAAADRVGSAEMRAMATAVRLRPQLWTAGPTAALAAAGHSADQPRSRAWWRINRVELALVHAATGDRRGCLDLLADSPSPQSTHPPILVARHVIAAITFAAAGDLTAAKDASDRAQALAVTAGLAYERALAGFSQAFIAYRMRRPGQAVALADRTAAGFAEAGTPMEEALSHHLAGAAHLAAGQLQHGGDSFDRAEAGYLSCGAVWISSVLASHRAGAPASAGQLPPGVPSNGVTLTAREAEIANLVKTGLSNKEIATQLYLSRRTVESHLNRIFAKLEVRSRTAMARRLAEMASRETHPVHQPHPLGPLR